MKHISALLSVAIVGCWFGTAHGADQRPLDDKFLIKVSSCENATVEISKLADKRAGSASVKEFAAQLVTDHQKCHERVAGIVKNRKIAIVSGLEKDVKENVDRLSKLNGAEFDREYLKWVIDTHKDAIATFENQADKGQDGDTRSFAKETLPHLRDHLKRAEELAKTIN